MAQVDDVIATSKAKKEVEWTIDPEILAILQASNQDSSVNEVNDWKLVVEDNVITGVQNSKTGVQKSLKLPVITPKLLVYDAHEDL